VRLTFRLIGLAGLAACASMGEPPGGPPRTTPPAILAITPDSGAIVPELKGNAVIQFDEVIDEMAGGGGAGGGMGGGYASGGGGGAAPGGIGRQVLLSPVAGDVSVTWHRSEIHIKPREGWKLGRVYRLQLLPGIIDLRHNILKRGRTVIFSTGPALPHASIRGTALQWVEQRALGLGLIRAVLAPDTVAYLTMTDSAGNFRLDDVPPGQYVVYAVNDANSNRRRDGREAYDSTTLTLDSSATAVLWTFAHDTLGPRIRAADPIDSLSFRLTFSQPLSIDDSLDTSRVRVVELPDSTPVPLAMVLTQSENDSVVAKLRATADSLRRAADTTHQAADTGKKGVPAPAPANPGARRGIARGDTSTRVRGDTTHLIADTSALRRLLSERPIPNDRLVIRVVAPLKTSTKYYIRIQGTENLNGAFADPVAVLSIPEPKKIVPADTAKVKPNPKPAPPKAPAPVAPDSTKKP
jgi:hypothetical protein